MDNATDLVQAHTVLSVVIGSRAYGLETDDSDTDRRGVFAAPTPLFWHLAKPPTHVDGPLPEQFSWEVERFCVLALESNPTILECLWSPIVERVTPIGERLLAIRTAFLSSRAHRSFVEYANTQFRRIDPDNPRSPHLPGDDPRPRRMAMHMIRLLLSGRHLLRYGEPLVRVDAYRDRLLAIRNGELPWDEVDAWRRELIADIPDAPCPLPPAPDRTTVDEFLVSVRKANL